MVNSRAAPQGRLSSFYGGGANCCNEAFVLKETSDRQLRLYSRRRKTKEHILTVHLNCGPNREVRLARPSAVCRAPNIYPPFFYFLNFIIVDNLTFSCAADTIIKY